MLTRESLFLIAEELDNVNRVVFAFCGGSTLFDNNVIMSDFRNRFIFAMSIGLPRDKACGVAAQCGDFESLVLCKHYIISLTY